MRVFTNEPLIKRRAKIGQFVSWAGLAILAIGMVISFQARPGVLTTQSNEPDAIARSVASQSHGVGFLDYDAYTANEAQVRVLPIDGVGPNQETIASGEYPLAGDGEAVAVIVHPGNNWIPQEGVTMDQLAQIFSTENERWSAVEAGWPNSPIRRFAPVNEAGAFSLFVSTVMEPVFGPERAIQVLLSTPNPNYTWLLMGSFACLILGFIAANVGGYNMRRFGRSPRPDERLAKELKGFDDRYMLFVWLLPVPYVFAGPSGIYAFATRDQGGKVTNTGDRWQQPFSFLRFLTAFGQEGLGNPTQEARGNADKMQQYLGRHMPELDTEVQPLVLFLNPAVQLQLNNPAIPVIQPKSLKALLRQRSKERRLEKETLQQLETLFTSTPK